MIAAEQATPAKNVLADLGAEALREDATIPPEAAAQVHGGAALPLKRAVTQADIDEWRAAIDLAADELADTYPALKAVYTVERRATLAARIAAVAVKYDLTPFAFFEKYKEEIALVMVAGPLLKATLKVIKAAKAAPPPAAEPAPKSAPVPAGAAAGAESLRPTAGAEA